MKKDLFAVILVGIVGMVIAFFVCNFFLSPVEDFSYKTVDSNASSDIAMPDPEVFNYRALNPTVEVYVGECEQYDEVGECIEVEALDEPSTE